MICVDKRNYSCVQSVYSQMFSDNVKQEWEGHPPVSIGLHRQQSSMVINLFGK